jgi:polyhydroxybutyrate depolymerase
MLFFLVVLWPVGSVAAAGCDIGAYDGACTTRNGHYRIRTPAGSGPWPAVVYLYGSLGNSARQIQDESFVQAFVDRGYAVIVPVALDLRYVDGVGSGWELRNEGGRKQRDDMAFIAEVLDDAEVRHRIDRSRVLITGMSRGGFLTWDIACHAPGLAAAYAPIAAGYLGDMPSRCAGPARLLHTHGRADEVVPIDNARLWHSGGARMEPLGSALTKIARTGGCITPAAPREFQDYDLTTWQDCGPGASAGLLLHSGGHIVPLSWYSTVIDWFENGLKGTGPARPEGNPRFLSAGATQPAKGNSRFRRPATASE